jgi:multiple sugar transport system substrate-binding protein
VAPLDDIIPDFESWRANFPPGVFLEGITTFGGKTYTFPLSSNQRYGTMVFFNDALMERAGLAIPDAAMSWTEFREAARKLTEAGSGSSYGFIIGGKDSGRLAEIVTNFAAMVGAVGSNTLAGPMNWLTGEYNYVTDEFLAAVELLLAMNSDGSIFPGSLSLSQPDADARMAQGMAAMTLDGPWLIDRWEEEAPDFQYSLGSQPIQDGAKVIPLGYPAGGANPHFIFSESAVKEVAGDLLAQWGTPDGQKAFQRIVGGALRAILPGASEGVQIDERSQQALTWFNEQMRLHPDPRARNPDVGMVFLEEQRLQPNFGEVMQGLMTGQLTDPKMVLQDLQDRAEAELERAIKAAQAKGAQVSRDDWVFPNWDPMRDYTDDQYSELN